MDKVVEAIARPIHDPKDPCSGIAGLQDHPKWAIPVCYPIHKFFDGIFSSRRN
jgi:hypothetical protein